MELTTKNELSANHEKKSRIFNPLSLKGKVFLIFSVLVFLVGVSLFIYAKYFPNHSSSSMKKCYTEVVETVRGKSMAPLIKNGQQLTLLKGYYNCHPIKRGDIIAYQVSENKPWIIKRVMVIGGDRVEWEGNQLKVNGQILTNSVGRPYRFSRKEKTMISFYLKEGRLIPDAYLIFGEEETNSYDSRRFGAIGKADIVGKFKL